MKKLLLLSLITGSLFSMEPTKPGNQFTKTVAKNTPKTDRSIYFFAGPTVPLIPTIMGAPVIVPTIVPVMSAIIAWTTVNRIFEGKTDIKPENNRQ